MTRPVKFLTDNGFLIPIPKSGRYSFDKIYFEVYSASTKRMFIKVQVLDGENNVMDEFDQTFDYSPGLFYYGESEKFSRDDFIARFVPGLKDLVYKVFIDVSPVRDLEGWAYEMAEEIVDFLDEKKEEIDFRDPDLGPNGYPRRMPEVRTFPKPRVEREEEKEIVVKRPGKKRGEGD